MIERPTYEGRPFTDPDDLVVDQGLQFDLGTLLKRRGLLQLFGVGVGTITLSACAAAAPTTTDAATSSPSAAPSTTASASIGDLTEIPEETAGPYPGDGSNGADVLEQSGVVRSDIRSSFGTSTTTAEGIPMTLELTILDLANGGAPFAGTAVYVWHCTRDGGYSMYTDGLTQENYLRGVQIADADGKVRFTSIFPGCYSGRWPHIHFEVYPDEASITDANNKIATSQVALPQAICQDVYATDGYANSTDNLAGITLASDNVFGDDEGAHQLGAVTGDLAGGLTVTLSVPVDTSTEPGQGESMGGNGPGQGPQPPKR
ncbi:3,4-dioxygenase subunit beta [Tessaracoccus aquimaris]|uniref:3,4-dioxygenase subunit beta n=1 Tax=Tessaracoccus aquimaris TaxID=1332264 RepID=A0A1Q2CSB8_9ACTN|nr:intradiol ring-cleavage dioxygenase [Tessaracoccus aquimaris]AQP48997.1 3,4-dioxygenase subunit beta [Tessaracoccus aquimaris]